MKELPQVFDGPKTPLNPNPAASAEEAESCCNKTAMSDAELEQISAAGDSSVPTMNPEVLLGRHALPSDPVERKP